MRRSQLVALVIAVGAVGGLAVHRVAGMRAGHGSVDRAEPAAVEVAAVEHGPIELRRILTGTLEARGRFTVAANVGGRVERLLVDLADPVRQGQVIAELDDAEQSAGVAEARAEMAVARANLEDAESALEISKRQLERTESLSQRGLVPDTELDVAKSSHLAKQTGLQVAKAQLNQTNAAFRRAHVRSEYTKVIAHWSGDAQARVVAARHVAEGDTVAANDPLITVVDLDPLNAVVHVTERDYALVQPGQQAVLTTEAYADERFSAEIRRIAPVFQERSRQARMELEVANPDGKLKPGMFVRVELVLDRVEDATIVPLAALVNRDGRAGLFLVDEGGEKVTWRPVEVGIQQGERLQVMGEGIAGRVVTLGQELIDDGSAVTIPERPAAGGREEP